jgi:4-amino-4-deoxy-L-arabinose transferase-like glycosyltransferase
MANLALRTTQAPGFSQSFLSDQPAHFRSWALVVLLLAALLFLLRLGDRSFWGSESRWGEITREMQLTGNYFWPTINGEVYYDKPLLSYWLIAATTYLTGELNELTVRLPSAVAGLLGVALLMVLTRQLYGERTAILAGFILATCFSYVFWSRVASADIENVAGVLAALTLYFRNQERPTGWWVVGLWLIMSVTSLTKGLLGFVLPLLVIGSYSLLADGWRNLAQKIRHGPWKVRLGWFVTQNHWFFNYKTLFAMGVAVCVYALPFAISAALMGSNIGPSTVVRENFTRFFEPFDHRGPFYLYTYAIFELMAPWCLFLPAALIGIHVKPEGRSDRFVLAYFWATFVFFTLSGSRRDYYLLPILPAAAIMVARLFSAPWKAWVSRISWLMNVGFFLLVFSVALMAVIGAIGLFVPAVRPEPFVNLPPLVERTLWVGFFTFTLMLIVAVITYRNLRPERIALSVSFQVYLFLLFLFVFAWPNFELFRGEKAFADTVRAKLNEDLSRLVLYRTSSRGLAGFVYYLSAKKPLAEYSDNAELARHIANDPDSWIVVLSRHLPSLPGGATIEARSKDLRWQKGDDESDYVLVRYVQKETQNEIK